MKRHLMLLAAGAVVTGPAFADEIDFLCYQDGTECDVIADLSAQFTAETGHTVNVNTVGYDIIRDQLENQLAAGEAPDVARVTNLGGLNEFIWIYRPLSMRLHGKQTMAQPCPGFAKPMDRTQTRFMAG